MHGHRITPEELEAALAEEPRPLVLDVRPLADYEAGHVPGARHLPVHELAARRRELPSVKVRRIVVAGEPGKRSEAAVNWLVLMGFPDVAMLAGGMPAWRGPLEQGPPPEPPPSGPRLRVLP